MKKLLSILCLSIILVFTNCSDDDDDQITDNYNDSNYFKSEFFNLSDNSVSNGWEFKAIREADISNGRINAYTNDGAGIFYKKAEVADTTKEIILEMDAYIAYSYWGLKPIFRIYNGDKYLGFRTGEEDYDHPANNIANEVLFHDGSSNIYIYESLSPTIPGTYHLKLIMNNTGYEFSGIDPKGNRVFKIFISQNEYLNYYFDFTEIDEIQFAIFAQTDNDGWIDNLRITVVE